jgi:hypothetical protein
MIQVLPIMDSDLSACKRIEYGIQSMKSFKQEAFETAEIVYNLESELFNHEY